MSSYLSNLLTSTTSRYDSLRRNLLSSEADGDTEDDSHISRSLRAYYTEKGRPYPPWLPPDPKAPQSAPAQFVSSSGRQQQQQQNQYGGAGRGGGGLGDIFDDAPRQRQQQEPNSLRRAPGRGGGGGRQLGGSRSTEPQAQGRPLPSQRAGSYQSSYEPAEQSPPQSAGSGMTAQEKLKARLWGSGRSTSPAQSATSSNSSFSAPPPSGPSRFERGGRDDRDNRDNRGGGGRLPYPDDRSGGYSPGGGGGGGRQPGQLGRQQDSYGMSANSPWSGSDDPYAPDRSQQQRQPGPPGGGRVGLPSGPRMR